MKRVCLAALAVLLLVACNEQTARLGRPAPEIAAVDPQGEPVKLSQWRGKSIYLNFWSSGCGICLTEMPILEALSRKHRDTIEVVSINIDFDDTSLQPTIDAYGLTFPMLRDSFGMTRERYPIAGTPTAFLIGPDGAVKRIFLGAPPENELAEVFRTAAGGS